jgi:hypothetical protein
MIQEAKGEERKNNYSRNEIQTWRDVEEQTHSEEEEKKERASY